MTNSADINRYKGLAMEALRATGAKLRKNFVDVFIEVMFLIVSVRKVNFTQMGKNGTHAQHFDIHENYVRVCNHNQA